MRTSDQPNVVLVSDVESSIETTSVSVDRTFADLGYVDEVMTGMGVTSRDYLFFVPPGQVTNDEAYLDLMYSHSALLDFELSGMVVRLNRQNFAAPCSRKISLRGDPKGAHSARAAAPGMNRLTRKRQHPIRVLHVITNNLWTAISSARLLHIPLNRGGQPGRDGDWESFPTAGHGPHSGEHCLRGGLLVAAPWDVAGKFRLTVRRRSMGNLVELSSFMATGTGGSQPELN
jgi:hypothetical protein